MCWYLVSFIDRELIFFVDFQSFFKIIIRKKLGSQYEDRHNIFRDSGHKQSQWQEYKNNYVIIHIICI